MSRPQNFLSIDVTRSGGLEPPQDVAPETTALSN